jgi:hypothetical protein
MRNGASCPEEMAKTARWRAKKQEMGRIEDESEKEGMSLHSEKPARPR